MVLILVPWLSDGLHLLCYQDAVRHKAPQWMTHGACHTLTWMQTFICKARPLVAMVRQLISFVFHFSGLVCSLFLPLAQLLHVLRLPIVIKPVAHTASQMG